MKVVVINQVSEMKYMGHINQNSSVKSEVAVVLIVKEMSPVCIVRDKLLDHISNYCWADPFPIRPIQYNKNVLLSF